MTTYQVPLTEEAVKEFLDKRIEYWRSRRDEIEIIDPDTGNQYEMCRHYIDAFQTVRVSLFCELKE